MTISNFHDYKEKQDKQRSKDATVQIWKGETFLYGKVPFRWMVLMLCIYNDVDDESDNSCSITY